jgi:hypothetical protein
MFSSKANTEYVRMRSTENRMKFLLQFYSRRKKRTKTFKATKCDHGQNWGTTGDKFSKHLFSAQMTAASAQAFSGTYPKSP